MSALPSERCRHYHPSDVVTIIRAMSLLSCVNYSSCMGITIWAMLLRCHYTIRAMSALSAERCHHYHEGNVRQISLRLSAFLLAPSSLSYLLFGSVPHKSKYLIRLVFLSLSPITSLWSFWVCGFSLTEPVLSATLSSNSPTHYSVACGWFSPFSCRWWRHRLKRIA